MLFSAWVHRSCVYALKLCACTAPEVLSCFRSVVKGMAVGSKVRDLTEKFRCSDHLMEDDFSSLLVTDFLGHAPAAKPTVARPVPFELGTVLKQASEAYVSTDSLVILPDDFAWKQYVH